MKKSHILFLVIIIALIGGSIWLLRGVDAKHVQRQETVIDVTDTFEK